MMALITSNCGFTVQVPGAQGRSGVDGGGRQAVQAPGRVLCECGIVHVADTARPPNMMALITSGSGVNQDVVGHNLTGKVALYDLAADPAGAGPPTP